MDHRRVVRHDLGDEALDPLAGRPSRELLEKPRADSASLVVVGDREGHLRAQRIPKPHVVREGDDPVFAGFGHRARESSPVDPVRIENGVDEPLVDGRAAVEAQVQASERQLLEEPDERLSVRVDGRAQPESAPVAEDDVDRVGVGSRHASILAPRRRFSPDVCHRS